MLPRGFLAHRAQPRQGLAAETVVLLSHGGEVSALLIEKLKLNQFNVEREPHR